MALLSGGLDSATTVAAARERGYAIHAVTFDYGQRHRVELQAAQRIAECLGVASHRCVKIDLRSIGGSALTSDIEVPKDRQDLTQPSEAHEHNKHIPVTYVPARNTIFLSYALAIAEAVGAGDIFIGANAVDYSGYPDCRPDYLQAFEVMANLATKAAVQGRQIKIHAPLIDLTKTQIIQEALRLGVDIAATHSCYDPDAQDLACGRCDACALRRDAFEQLGMADPALEHLKPAAKADPL